MRFDHGEKIHLLSTCCSSEKKKKTPDFVLFFQTISLFSRLFPGLQIAGQISRNFSRIDFSVPTLI